MIRLSDCFYLHSPEVDDPMAGWDVLLDESRISAIEPTPTGSATAANVRTTDEVINCSRHVVVPGFVNTHHHFFQTLTRNLPAAQNAKLFDWLVYHYQVWKHLDEEAVAVSSRLAIAELLKTGCTCTTDHHYLYPENFGADLPGIQFEAADELGIRFSPSRGSMSRGESTGGLPPDSVVQDEELILRDSLRVIERYHDTGPHAMHKVTLAPCSPFSVTPELMRDSARMAREHGVRLHTHLAETADEDDYCIANLNMRPLELMEKCDFVGPDVSFAHGIHFTDSELKRLAETGTGVCHCPSSNMRLGSGIARVSEMEKLGVPVSLAVDGSASNDASDYLGEMRNAMLLQRVRYGADAIGAREVFKIATESGAKMLGFPQSGAIRVGWTADIATFDVHRLEYAGSLEDPLAALVFAGISHQTDHTIVNGKIVVKGGHLVALDEAKLAERANKAAARLLVT